VRAALVDPLEHEVGRVVVGHTDHDRHRNGGGVASQRNPLASV